MGLSPYYVTYFFEKSFDFLPSMEIQPSISNYPILKSPLSLSPTTLHPIPLSMQAWLLPLRLLFTPPLAWCLADTGMTHRSSTAAAATPPPPGLSGVAAPRSPPPLPPPGLHLPRPDLLPRLRRLPTLDCHRCPSPLNARRFLSPQPPPNARRLLSPHASTYETSWLLQTVRELLAQVELDGACTCGVGVAIRARN